MRAVPSRTALPALDFLRNISLEKSELTTLEVMAILLFGLVVSALPGSVGLIVMEIGFPLLAGWILTKRTVDRFEPTMLFPAIYLLWFWLGNIPLLIEDRYAAVTTNPGGRVWFYCLLGLFAYLCGTFVIRAEAIDSSALRGVKGRWQDGQLLLFLGMLGAAIFFAWASITVSEGIPIFKSNVDTFRLEVSGRHHIAFQVLIGFSTLMLPLTFLYIWTAKTARFRKSLYAFSIFIVFIFVSLGSRGLVLPAALTIFALRHYLRKPWPVKYIAGAGLVLLPLLSVSGYYRSLQHFGPTYALDLIEMGIPLPLQPFTNIYLYVRAPIETFRNVLNVIPAVAPFQHGSLSFGFLLQLLPGRHPSSDYFFKEVLGHAEDGFGEPASLLGTFYADFGGPGIFVGMFLTGSLVKAIYVHMFRGSLGWVLTYCFLWQKLVGSLYGSLFTYVTEVLVPIVWLISIWILTRGSRPEKASLEPAARLP